jgi:hypothetical protein
VKTQPEVSPATASGGATYINAAYIADAAANVQTILDAMPGIRSENTLLEECGGFIAPYKPDMYNKKWAEAGSAGKSHYQSGINLFWQSCVANPVPSVPMYKPRIE